jgi:predicted TIM-barrel fold metal-dependent hydrolase
MLSRRTVVSGLGLSGLALLSGPLRPARAAQPVPITDTHAHFARAPGGGLGEFSAPAALAELDRFGIERVILSPPPIPPGRGRVRLADIRAAVRGSARLAFAAGGESLNPILQETPADRVSATLTRRFLSIAEEIAAAGAASFGELAAEHFSSGRGRHPYESSPPDHPLLLALAELAARRGMPVDLHMEAVPQDMSFPPDRPQGPNPARLTANIARLERLLEHSPGARIVWLHAGWDLTGERTVALMHGLLERHANLAMSIKCDAGGTRATAPFLPEEGAIRPAWLAMLRAFPDRFMIGSDQFLGEDTERFENARRLVDALPAELARLVAGENARRIYRLTAG